MAHTPTGKPVGRPKTKDYKTISLKMPQEFLERVQHYARLHHQSVSELIRDGLEWRITEGDPRSVGVSVAQRTTSHTEQYAGNTEIPDDGVGESEHPGVLQDIMTALAQQGAQLTTLTQALMHQSSEYSSNTTQEMTGQQTVDTAIEPGNTVLPETVLPETVPPFDPSKFYLGQLCPHGHAYEGTGQSLRGVAHRNCMVCRQEQDKVRKREARQRKRQAQPA